MNATAQPAPAATGFPTRAQAITLALAMMEHRLRGLISIRTGDEHWCDDDADVDNAMDLALAHTLRMKEMQFDKDCLFDREVFLVASAVSMGVRLFSRQDCYYFRALRGTAAMLTEMVAMVDFVERAAV